MKITLKAARVMKNLTQKEAAEKIGISKDTLGNYERGYAFPNVLVIKRMEELYGVEYRDINFFNPNNALSVKDNNAS